MINNHVTSLEISKRLKELGVRQRSEFTWVMSTSSDTDNYKNGEYKLECFGEFYGVVKNYYAAGADNKDFPMFSAFLSSDLGGILPYKVTIKNKTTGLNQDLYLQIRKCSIGWTCLYIGEEKCNGETVIDYKGFSISKKRYYHTGLIEKFAKTEIEAKAKMLICLLENELIKLN